MQKFWHVLFSVTDKKYILDALHIGLEINFSSFQSSVHLSVCCYSVAAWEMLHWEYFLQSDLGQASEYRIIES